MLVKLPIYSYKTNKSCDEHLSSRYSIVLECWNSEPEKRPNFSELATDICGTLEDMAGYLDLTTPSATNEMTAETEIVLTRPLSSLLET